MDYLIKASAIILIFYLFYRLLLQRDTFFNLNRWFLLCGIFAAFTLPFAVIPIYIEAPTFTGSTINTTTITASNTENTPFYTISILTWGYVIGLLFFLGRFINQVFALSNVLANKKSEKKEGVHYIKTQDNISPFSFFNYIVYNPNNFTKTELAQILAHEKVHVQQKHSIDTILIQLGCAVLWFNPFIWLYAKRLKLNLEFIADKAVTDSLSNKKTYQYTLLKTSMSTHHTALSTPFYNSLIKKRIVMLHKPKSKTVNRSKFALIIPVLALFLMSFNTKTVYTKKFTKQTDKNIAIVFNKNTTDQDLKNIEQTLKQSGITFTYTNFKRNSSHEITSISTKFKDSTGSVTMSTSNTKTGITPFIFYKSNEKIGVTPINNEVSEKWKTKFIIGKPFNTDSLFFNSTNTKEQISVYTVKTDSMSMTNSIANVIKLDSTKKEKPLVIINGKKIPYKDLDKIKPNAIKQVHVIKNAKQLKKYGKQAKNGVILIETKTNN